MDERQVPRWQQGLRPIGYGEVWDAMSPAERRRAFRADFVIAAVGLAVIWGVGKWVGL